MTIPEFINLSEVARRCGRSKGWLYQRLNGYTVNGKPAQFREDEIAMVRGVLYAMMDELKESLTLMDV